MKRRGNTKIGAVNQKNGILPSQSKSIDQAQIKIAAGYYFPKTIVFCNQHCDSYICYHCSLIVSCELCSKSFSKRCNLNTHIRIEHENQRYECQECGELFKSAFGLRKHSNNIHSRKGSRAGRIGADINSSKVILEEDADFSLSADEKDRLILELKQRIITLKACNDKYRAKIASYKNEIKTLRILKSKSKAEI